MAGTDCSIFYQFARVPRDRPVANRRLQRYGVPLANMANMDRLEQKLQRWVEAGVIDAESAQRVRSFERSSFEDSPHGRTPGAHGLRWPVVLAVSFGALMIAAGVLLFVAAHWDELSPAQRFALVLAMVGGFHLAAGALMPRLRSLGIALHGVGTATLGAGIFLAAQIFNLQEHWPTGILLWAVGAVLGWVVLRDWLQATLAMLLAPAWIASEWGVRAEHYAGMEKYLIVFLALLAFAYLGALRGWRHPELRRALAWIGGLALLPSAAALAFVGHEWGTPAKVSSTMLATGALLAYGLPLGVAWVLRGKGVLWNAGFALWAWVLGSLDYGIFSQNLAIFAIYALGSIALVLWGLQERRRERVDLGVAGFAITVIAFYFSTMMDKLGRSASLVGFGLLFLLGGWKLEQLRRKLVARMGGVRPDASATGVDPAEEGES